jgi:hypothetical protein
MSLRTSLMAAAALVAVAAATPAFAQSGGGNGGDSNIDNFVRQSPKGMAPTSNGVPTIVDNRDGQPVIEYRGARRGVGGVEDGRIPRVVDNRGGSAEIRYGAGGRPPAQAPGARRPMRTANAGSRTRAEVADAGSPAHIGRLLGQAQSSIQQGRYGAASATLEEAETRLLNARADGTNGNDGALRAIGEARTASNKRDRRGATDALGTAMQQMGPQG